MTRARAGRDPDPRPRRIQAPELLAMWIPDRGREGRGQVPATSPAHGAQRSRKGRRRRLGRILPKLLFIGSIKIDLAKRGR